jgi:hypothetical protein
MEESGSSKVKRRKKVYYSDLPKKRSCQGYKLQQYWKNKRAGQSHKKVHR